jgi:hypothetical protein
LYSAASRKSRRKPALDKDKQYLLNLNTLS